MSKDNPKSALLEQIQNASDIARRRREQKDESSVKQTSNSGDIPNKHISPTQKIVQTIKARGAMLGRDEGEATTASDWSDSDDDSIESAADSGEGSTESVADSDDDSSKSVADSDDKSAESRIKASSAEDMLKRAAKRFEAQNSDDEKESSAVEYDEDKYLDFEDRNPEALKFVKAAFYAEIKARESTNNLEKAIEELLQAKKDLIGAKNYLKEFADDTSNHEGSPLEGLASAAKKQAKSRLEKNKQAVETLRALVEQVKEDAKNAVNEAKIAADEAKDKFPDEEMPEVKEAARQAERASNAVYKALAELKVLKEAKQKQFEVAKPDQPEEAKPEQPKEAKLEQPEEIEPLQSEAGEIYQAEIDVKKATRKQKDARKARHEQREKLKIQEKREAQRAKNKARKLKKKARRELYLESTDQERAEAALKTAKKYERKAQIARSKLDGSKESEKDFINADARAKSAFKKLYKIAGSFKSEGEQFKHESQTVESLDTHESLKQDPLQPKEAQISSKVKQSVPIATPTSHLERIALHRFHVKAKKAMKLEEIEAGSKKAIYARKEANLAKEELLQAREIELKKNVSVVSAKLAKGTQLIEGYVSLNQRLDAYLINRKKDWKRFMFWRSSQKTESMIELQKNLTSAISSFILTVSSPESEATSFEQKKAILKERGEIMLELSKNIEKAKKSLEQGNDSPFKIFKRKSLEESSAMKLVKSAEKLTNKILMLSDPRSGSLNNTSPSLKSL